MDLDIGEVIAARSYRLVDENNNDRAVSVLVDKPQPAKDLSDYQCPFQLTGIGSRQPGSTFDG
jgi:hypothetical protein